MARLDFKLKILYETRNYFLEETKHNNLMSEKHKKECKTSNHFDHFLNFINAVSDLFQFLYLLHEFLYL